ncbi:MAG: hypothetical protein WD824_03470 [Cyclobacteriaceae bacterium]
MTKWIDRCNTWSAIRIKNTGYRGTGDVHLYVEKQNGADGLVLDGGAYSNSLASGCRWMVRPLVLSGVINILNITSTFQGAKSLISDGFPLFQDSFRRGMHKR